MKRFLDKTWAKAAAFVLTLVFGVLTVLGGVCTAALISYDVFLDDGAFARQSLYENRCYSAVDHADSFLRGNLANAGLLSDADGYDYSNIENSPTAVPGEESIPSFLKELSQDFSNEFTLDGFGCHLTVASDDTGEVYLENFALTYTDKPLYTVQSTRLYTLSDGSIYALTYTVDLLQVETAPTYSYLLLSWLTEHAGLMVTLTVLAALLSLFFFCFSMASAGHWAGHEGIHLTWLDKIPADVWLLVLLCTFFIGWEAFYYEWGRVFFCAALVPLVLLFLCAFAAQCKAGTVLRSALIGRIARFLWRIVRAIFRALLHTLARLPLVWKTALVGLVIAGAEFLLYINDFYRVRYGVFLMMKIIELLAVLYIAVSLRALQKGGEKLARGDFSSPIDTRYLIGDFKRYGQELNDVQGGLEQAVQEQMKAEHLKTELITNVSHDIKTPLTSIVNYVDLLKKEDMPSPAAQEYIAVLDRQSHRLKKLTEDLVEASKASSGALNVELQPTDVNVLLSQIEGEYQERLAACHLTLVTQPPAPGTMIQADSRLLSRVMDNLVSNVCKYAMENTRVYVTAAVRDGQAVISFKNVSRDELNISPDELMERFVRGDASRHSEGSGLGLSIARSLVQLQGGTFALSIDADLFRADIVFPLI
jgi:signal transduction histidine kinase